MGTNFGQVVGIDDAPFPRGHRGDVRIVGAVYSGERLDGVLSTRVRRDGANATDRIAEMITASRFRPALNAVLLQGIAVAGFNVIDIHRLSGELGLPVVVVTRTPPDMTAIRQALETHVPGGQRKWRLIERAGPMEKLGPVQIQRAGVSHEEARELIRRHARHGHLPDPIRTAHLIAAGVTGGESRHRA